MVKSRTLHTANCKVILLSPHALTKCTFNLWLKDIHPREAQSDINQTSPTLKHRREGKFNIQELRETERLYHQSQRDFERQRDEQRRRSSEIRAQRFQSAARQRVTCNYRNKYRSTYNTNR